MYILYIIETDTKSKEGNNPLSFNAPQTHMFIPHIHPGYKIELTFFKLCPHFNWSAQNRAFNLRCAKGISEMHCTSYIRSMAFRPTKFKIALVHRPIHKILNAVRGHVVCGLRDDHLRGRPGSEVAVILSQLRDNMLDEYE